MLPPLLWRTSMIKPCRLNTGKKSARPLGDVLRAHRAQMDIADLARAQFLDAFAPREFPFVIAQVRFAFAW